VKVSKGGPVPVQATYGGGKALAGLKRASKNAAEPRNR
jgi:hypothetical protein